MRRLLVGVVVAALLGGAVIGALVRTDRWPPWDREAAGRGDGPTGGPATAPWSLVGPDGVPYLDPTDARVDPDVGAWFQHDGFTYSLAQGRWTAVAADGRQFVAGTTVARFAVAADGTVSMTAVEVADGTGHPTEVVDRLVEEATTRLRQDAALRRTGGPLRDGVIVVDGDGSGTLVLDPGVHHVWVEPVADGFVVVDGPRTVLVHAGDDGAEVAGALLPTADSIRLARAPGLRPQVAGWLDAVTAPLPGTRYGDGGLRITPVDVPLARPQLPPDVLDVSWIDRPDGSLDLVIGGTLVGNVHLSTADGAWVLDREPWLPTNVAQRAEQEWALAQDRLGFGADLNDQLARPTLQVTGTGDACAGWGPCAGTALAFGWTAALGPASVVSDGWQPSDTWDALTGRWIPVVGAVTPSPDQLVDSAGDLAVASAEVPVLVVAETARRIGVDGLSDPAAWPAASAELLLGTGELVWQQVGVGVDRSCLPVRPGPGGGPDGTAPPAFLDPGHRPPAARRDEYVLARAWMPELRLSEDERCGELLRVVAKVLLWTGAGRATEVLADAERVEIVYTLFFAEDGGRLGGGVVQYLPWDWAHKAAGHAGDNEGMVVGLVRTSSTMGRCGAVEGHPFAFSQARAHSHEEGPGGFTVGGVGISELTDRYESLLEVDAVTACPPLGPASDRSPGDAPVEGNDLDGYTVFVAEMKHALWFDELACERALAGLVIGDLREGIEECDRGRAPVDVSHWVELWDQGPRCEGGLAVGLPGGWPPSEETYDHAGSDRSFYCQTRGSRDATDRYHVPKFQLLADHPAGVPTPAATASPTPTPVPGDAPDPDATPTHAPTATPTPTPAPSPSPTAGPSFPPEHDDPDVSLTLTPHGHGSTWAAGATGRLCWTVRAQPRGAVWTVTRHHPAGPAADGQVPDDDEGQVIGSRAASPTTTEEFCTEGSMGSTPGYQAFRLELSDEGGLAAWDELWIRVDG